MRTAIASKDRIRRSDRPSGDWLVELLAEVRREVVAQPTPQAVARIRQRLAAELQVPRVRAA